MLFCVKSFDTETAAAAMAPHVASDAVVLSLQNGVDNPEPHRPARPQSGDPGGWSMSAPTSRAPGTVCGTGGGNIVIGQLKAFREDAPDGELLAGIAALFGGGGPQGGDLEEIEAELWIKLLMNSTYNAISALGRSAYGRMVAMPEVNVVMREAARRGGSRSPGPRASACSTTSSRPR